MPSSDTAPWPTATSFPSMPDGTKPKGRRKAQPTVASLKAVGKMRPARGEIIIATESKRLGSGVQLWEWKDPEVGRAQPRTLPETHRCARGDRSLCQPCGEMQHAAGCARYAKANVAGKLYGGHDAKAWLRSARARVKRRYDACRVTDLCTCCGEYPSVEGGTVCGSCRNARRTAEREHYVARSAAGFCGRCVEAAFDGASLARFAHNRLAPPED